MARGKKNKTLPAPSKGSVVAIGKKTEVSLGPIPTAQRFEEYRTVRHDLPDLIIDTWQKDAEHRREMDRQELLVKARIANVEVAKVVVVSFFAIGMVCLAGYLAWKGKYELSAAVMASPLLVGIIDSFRKK